MIGNIQLVRAFAALLVAWFHTGYEIVPGVRGGGTEGVAIFFVISGFVMCLITRKDTSHFMTRRLIRIVPAYWGATLFLMLCQGWQWNTWRDIVYSLFFIPHLQSHGSLDPLLGVGWTLVLEMYFYALFAVFLRVNVAAAPGLTAVAILGLKFVTGWLWPGPVMMRYYANPIVYDFVYGIGIYYVWQWARPHLHRARVGAVWFVGLLAAAGGVVLCNADDAWLNATVIPILVVAGAVGVAALHGDVRSPLVMIIGESSYVLYLLHTVILEGLRVKFHMTLEHNLIGVGVFLGVATVLACMAHVYVERPVLRGLKGWLIDARNGRVIEGRY